MKKSKLVEKIQEANTSYAAGIPFMTDTEYDKLWKELYLIEPKNDLLYHTAQQRIDLNGLSYHKYPIFGTNKAFNMDDLKIFITRFGDQPLVIEPKYDGCAAVITFTKSNWVFTLEGDGKCGSDITHLASYINCKFDLRHFQAVEIIIPWEDWSPSYGKNPRNVVAGWLARKHDKPPINMTAIPHNFGNLKESYNYSGSLEDFSVFLLSLYSKWSAIYPIDGLMIKVADEQSRLIAGNNGQTNNWSIAWKPPIQTKETTVVDIEWNISRLGRIIPTVIYEPIELCSTTNSRVTGNNAQWIKEKQIMVGSTILVGKAGEIIPKILKVKNDNPETAIGQSTKTPAGTPERTLNNRLDKIGSNVPIKTDPPKNAPEATLPLCCPKCGESLKWEGVHLICNGPKCITKLVVSIHYFYSVKGIKIDGVGEAMVEKLLQDPKIYEVLSNNRWALLDIHSYNIFNEVFSVLGEKIYGNIFEQVQQVSKTKTMAHFISGLGFPGLGYKTSLRLCQYIKSGKLNIPISIVAKKNFPLTTIIFSNAKAELKNFQFAPLPESAKAIYCITGILSKSREAMIMYLAEYGYEFSHNVTRETNYLIMGQEPGKIKVSFAEKYNIPIISEEQFIKLLTKENKNGSKS